MKPLLTSQQVLTWLCMCATDDSTSKPKRMCYAAFTLIVGTIISAALLVSIGFIIKNFSTDFAGCLYAVFQVAAHIAILNLIIVGLINRNRIADLFAELSKLYNASMDRTVYLEDLLEDQNMIHLLDSTEMSFRFLGEANNKSEWLWQIYLKLGMGGAVVNMFISSIASIIYCYHKYGVFNANHLYKPYKNL